MIGARVGVVAGVAAGVACGKDPLGSSRRLVFIAGQSNATTNGYASALADPTLADPYAAVQYLTKQDGNTDPPVWFETSVGSLGKISYVNPDRVGLELSLMRDLDAAEPNTWACARMALGGTSLAVNWLPTGTYPTTESDNLFTQFLAYIRTAEAATGSELAAVVWVQGESDTVQEAHALAYEANLTAWINALRVEFPGVPVVVGQLHTDCAFGAYVSTVRAAQAAVAGALSDVALVSQDSAALDVDSIHYTTPGYVTLGHLHAVGVASLIGVNLLPTAAWSASENALEVTFTDESTDPDGSISSWAWNFGDGNTSTQQNPVHTYAAAGTYTVTLTVTDNGGATDETSSDVTVSEAAWTVDADSDKPMPADATEWAALMAANSLSITPASIYVPGADAGSPLDDKVGAFDLTLSGSGASYGVDVAGWDHDAATLTDDTTGGWRSLSASLPDLSASSCLLLARVRMPSSVPAGVRILMFMGSTTTAAVRINPSTGFITTTSGGNAATGAVNVCDGSVWTIALKVDRTGTVQRAYTPLEKLAPTFAAGLTGKAVYLGSNGAAADVGYVYAVRLDGAEAELSDAVVKGLLEALGETVAWSP